MPLLVNREEQNIQDRINQTRFGKVSYDQMPIGSVIQTQYKVFGGSGAANEAETSSSSYQPTLFQVDITPIFENSLMVITSAPNIKMNGDSGYQTLALYVSIDGGSYSRVLSPNNTASNVPHGQGTFRISGSSPWWGQAQILQMHRPQTTSPINYKIYHRNSSGGFVIRTGENGADEYIMVQEIKQ